MRARVVSARATRSCARTTSSLAGRTPASVYPRLASSSRPPVKPGQPSRLTNSCSVSSGTFTVASPGGINMEAHRFLGRVLGHGVVDEDHVRQGIAFLQVAIERQHGGEVARFRMDLDPVMR